MLDGLSLAMPKYWAFTSALSSRLASCPLTTMHEHLATPDYPNVVWAFFHRGLKIEITTSHYRNQLVYSAWVTHEKGSAVAVPVASTREIAIARAKQWIKTHFV